jgi:hypothetical protein
VLCAPISYEFGYKIEGMSREMSIRIIVRVVERWSGAIEIWLGVFKSGLSFLSLM